MRKAKVREIIALLIISFLIVFTLLYPSDFSNKFKDVVTVVLTYYFVSNEQQKECINPYLIRKRNNQIRGACSL